MYSQTRSSMRIASSRVRMTPGTPPPQPAPRRRSRQRGIAFRRGHRLRQRRLAHFTTGASRLRSGADPACGPTRPSPRATSGDRSQGWMPRSPHSGFAARRAASRRQALHLGERLDGLVAAWVASLPLATRASSTVRRPLRGTSAMTAWRTSRSVVAGSTRPATNVHAKTGIRVGRSICGCTPSQ